jgi:hypothetical protein
MPEEASIEVGALNIVATPHPPGIYHDLLELVSDTEIHIWGADYAKITKPHRRKSNPDQYRGHILVWTKVDKSGRWINKKKNEEASELEKRKIVIPEEVQPNFRSFNYALIESRHRLIIEHRNQYNERFGPTRVLRLFRELFSIDVLGEEAPTVTITPVPEDASLKRIMSMPRLRRLEIHLEQPNPDDLTPDVQRILERLEAEGAKSQDLILTKAPKIKSLTPDKDTRLLAEVAAVNGYVRGIGKDDDGERFDESTQEHPKRVTVVLEQHQSSLAAFLSALRFF